MLQKTRSIKNRHHLLFFTLSLSIVAGCTTPPAKQYQFTQETSQAESLLKKGRPKQAASLYQDLALSKPAQRDEYNLLAAEALIQSGDGHAAKTNADSINKAILSAEQRNRLNLLYGQIYLSNGDAEQALVQLKGTQVYNLPKQYKISYYQSLAFAYSLTGNLIQSAQARIQLTTILEDEQLNNDNHRVILKTLSLLPIKTLVQNQNSSPEPLGGWMALSVILKTAKLNNDSTEFHNNLKQWQSLYPNHPANEGFLTSYLSGTSPNIKLPASIAVLLPESGPYAQVAKVIKTGFMAAYNSTYAEFQPSVRFYDSSAINAVSLYQQAVAEGAELIIGPLSKDNIQNLALGIELTTPVLALNHVSNLVQSKLFQFGLSPIDEAQQLANTALNDNRSNILLLSPQSNKGQRTAINLTEQWQLAGGTVLEAQSYNARENDFSKPIKDLLNLDESKYRYNKLRRFLAKDIQFTERRRQDVDAIFLSTSAKTARSIYPQLRFYRATRVPVYATPEIYSGQPNPALDRDLNSITFCDIPWLFTETYQGDLSKEALRDTWQSIPGKYLKLLALGIDAFNIVPHLNQLNTTPYPAATGTLSLNFENRITRQLVCAKFTEGQPKLNDFSYQSAPSYESNIY